jgi:hypothetical protein
MMAKRKQVIVNMERSGPEENYKVSENDPITARED